MWFRRFLVCAAVAALAAGSIAGCGDGDVADPARSPLPGEADAGSAPDRATTTTGPTTTPTTSMPMPIPTALAGAGAATFPATTVLEPPAVPQGGLPPIGPVEVTEPCPESVGIGGDGEFGDDTVEEQRRLEPMLASVLAYGGQHPDQFGSYGLVWHGSGDASVFVSFTSDLDVHRAALHQIAEFPDELIVCQVPISGEVASALQAHLVAQYSGRFASVGRSMGAVEVVLAADQEALAADLAAQYGDAVDLTIGALAYPLDDAVDACTELQDTVDVPGLRFEVLSPNGPLYAVGVGGPQLTAELTNDGTDRIHFDSDDSGVATLLDAAGRVVSAHVFARAGMGSTVDLAPGASVEVPLTVSTASCRADLGYVLPPGEYQLIAELVHIAGAVSSVRSAPISVTVGTGG